MILDLAIFVAGLAVLYLGAEWLVGGASRLAELYGVSPLVVGLTIVAFGTSAPELVVSGLASYRGAGDLAVGNVIGSNIANIALILGVSALIRPIRVQRGLIVRDLPIMIAFAVLILLLTLNLHISRLEGVLLLALFTLYMVHVGRQARLEAKEAQGLAVKEKQILESLPGGKPRWARDVLLTVVGTLALAGGAQLLVNSATSIAQAFDVPEVVIGLTLVAFGTSVPELAASIVASLRGEAQIVVGNIVGSNIFNVSLILGAAALLRPLPVDPDIMRVEVPIMIVLSILLLPLVYPGLRLNRLEGGALLAGYVGFIVWVFL